MIDIPPPFDANWFLFVFGILLGGILGSFATMLVYRLPQHLSILFPRSHCVSCNTTLGARDLVPILSWLSTRGHCRYCRAPIGLRYLIIEILTSLGCAVASVTIGFAPALPIAYVIIVAAIVWAGTKIKR